MNQPHLDEATFHEYIDGIFSTPDLALELAQVEAHLASCEACRNRLAELQWLFVELDNLPEEQPSRDFALHTMAILNARANRVRTPALGFVTIQLLMTVIVAALLWPFLSHFLWRMVDGWSQLLQLQPATLPIRAAWPVMRGFSEQWTQTLVLLGQEVGERGWQGFDLPPLPNSLPELPVTLWLSLLGGICLLWAVATRCLLFLPPTHPSQPTKNGEAR